MSDIALQAERAFEAYKAGQEAANALQVGDLFDGAWPAAGRAGFDADPLRRIFGDGFLSALNTRTGNRGVICDEHGRIIRFGR